MALPDITVVVPTYRRSLRLRWLLNALEEQTLDPSRFEVVVVYHADDGAAERTLSSHPLAATGVVRPLPCPLRAPSVMRNAAIRTAQGRAVVFTDDDCRPPASWLEEVAAAVAANPDAIVQGRTTPDPDEWTVWETAPHPRSQVIHDPPTRWGQTCNIAYPRALLERLDGFDETFPAPSCEDTDLLRRALRAGADLVGAHEMLTYHAIEDHSLLSRLRTVPRWQHIPAIMRRYPEMRRDQPYRLFWKPTHSRWILGAAALGIAMATRNLRLAVFTVPWARSAWPPHGRHLRGRLRSLSELPGRALIDGAEVVALARGSVRYRTLFL